MIDRNFWFLDTLVQVRASFNDSSDRISVLEHRVPYGDSPPLHLHRTEDEIFYVLAGEFRFRVGEKQQRLGIGACVVAPKRVPHTYLAESAEGGRFLTVTSDGEFERFVRAVSRSTQHLELPTPAGPPTVDMMGNLAKIAANHGIEFCGPPLQMI
jgi:mannose-6-phosphate isomerase-like protein (cupin superfamily)